MTQLGKFKYPSIFDEDIATHVVTGVLYGADAFLVFDREVSKEEKYDDIHGNMEMVIKALPGVAPLNIKDINKTEVEKFRCTFYGDVKLPNNPTTYQGAVVAHKQLPKLLSRSKDDVPMKVWLYPLGKLDSRAQRIVCEISPQIVSDVEKLTESLHEFDMQCNDHIKNEVCSVFHSLEEKLHIMKTLLANYKATLVKSLATLLPQIRGGGVEEVRLVEIIEENLKSPFSHRSLSSWFKGVGREVRQLAIPLQRLQEVEVVFAFKSDELENAIGDSDKVLCFDFNVSGKEDTYLQNMQTYLRTKKISNAQASSLKPWYDTPHLQQAMQTQLQLFCDFVEANAGEISMKFVVTDGNSDLAAQRSDEVGVISLYQNGFSHEFQFPARPGKPQAEDVTHESVHFQSIKREVKTKLSPVVRPALLMYDDCEVLETKGDLKIYQLPTHITMQNEKRNLIKCTVGQPIPQGCTPSKHKVLMIVGATGAGKSTLINGFANYVMGVKFIDPFRFKLIVDDNQVSQAHSQTKCITAYTFPQMEGSPLDYTLTIIDTPGFGDTEGLERDKHLTQLIKEFFSIQGEEGIDQLHGIGFVAQASLPRLTPTQKYIFDAILSIFGKDIADNIFLLTTFADGETPPILEAVKTAGVPHKGYYKFNNSALFADKSGQVVEIFWRMGQESFRIFFESFSQATVQSLQLTRQVLDEREQLETIIEGLQEQIHSGLTKMESLNKEKQVLEKSKAEIVKNKDFTYEITETVHKKENLKGGKRATNCLKCDFTCHKKCTLNSSSKLHRCSAMANKRFYSSAVCGACPGECSWKEHKNTSYVVQFYRDTVTRTANDIAKRYQCALDSKAAVESVIMKMETELILLNVETLRKIRRAKCSIARLEEIALKPNPLTDEEYIELLIKSEKQQKKGFMDRIEALQKIKQKAQMLSKLKKEDFKDLEGDSLKVLAVFTE